MNFPLKVLILHTVIHNVQKNIIKSAISEMNTPVLQFITLSFNQDIVFPNEDCTET